MGRERSTLSFLKFIPFKIFSILRDLFSNKLPSRAIVPFPIYCYIKRRNLSQQFFGIIGNLFEMYRREENKTQIKGLVPEKKRKDFEIHPRIFSAHRVYLSLRQASFSSFLPFRFHFSIMSLPLCLGNPL